jgi:hypothetical protein
MPILHAARRNYRSCIAEKAAFVECTNRELENYVTGLGRTQACDQISLDDRRQQEGARLVRGSGFLCPGDWGLQVCHFVIQ